MKKITIILFALFLLVPLIHSQDSVQVVTLQDSTDITPAILTEDTVRMNDISDSTEVELGDSVKLAVDSTKAVIIRDTLNTAPVQPDTVEAAPAGMARFPINIKKTKFAYFDTTHSIDRIIETDAFKLGEKLEFVIRYGPIVAGSATMSIPEIREYKGRKCYHIESVAKSSKFFSSFFRVKDVVESYMDKDGLFSWRFEKHLREGKFRADQYVDHDHYTHLAVTDKKDTLRIPPCVQDILSAFYYVRTMPMEIGKSLFIDTHTDRKLYPLQINVLGRERIKTRAGTFNCIIIEPMLRSDAIFKQRGKLTIWMTDDNRKIPVLMKSKVIIGSIIAEIKKIKDGG